MVLFLALLLPTALLACPMCKEMLMDPGQAQAIGRAARGYLVSIAALIGIPLLLVAGVTAALLRSSRRAHRSLPAR